MERAKLVMRRAMGRLNIAYRQAQSNHILYLVLFAVVMFTILYILGKVRRDLKMGAAVRLQPLHARTARSSGVLCLAKEAKQGQPSL